ncbi:type VI secretion system Vgr family protein [Microbulbifer hydrolyticus]|uniref:Type VI secretion system secreted protein VgrG n=1 Tax=Microbulbifer hydrolyticus TaxID=48074 RepID=A0A6P1T758_9GAMM|nr:type VI secretion system tip protein TssI/VgrG [Microbulbifer hydrolyticus]MBB5211388.1 type VI secretion system secreted protein VgrG [Microbulbifer hydrolyticus]QHQ37857.1 type VI secretion system tip protein VgrG [Microbulbifer hydrolyticus]
MSVLNQDKRMIRTKCPIGQDTFIGTAISGEEHISGTYRYQIRLLSDNHDITQDAIVGKTFTVSIHYGPSEKFIHGYVTHFFLLDVNAEGLREYSAVIQPGFWFSQLGGKNRIFEKKSARDIIKEVLGEYASVVTFADKLNGEYLTREYCVQFNESDFQFVTRLMSEEGIAYYFIQTDGKHEMVLCDDHKSFYDSSTENIEYDGGGSHPTKHSVHSWQRSFNYHGGGFELKDYNEFTPDKDNMQNVTTTSKLNSVQGYIRNLYGMNHFEDNGDGTHAFKDGYHKELTKRAMEAQESGFDVATGTSDFSPFSAGGRFKFAHTLKSEKGKYLITSVRLSATDSNSEDSQFRNTFRCIPENVMPRPDPLVATQKIHSPQVAQVVNVKATESSGSEDRYTQLKVKFPWNSKQNSCWIRVMQSFSGKNWGANFVPRVGQEVVINYINGDPDRPLVTGAVFNSDNPGPQYTATQSGWKTQIKDSMYNELRFDDKKGSEEVYMEAGKDHNFLIHNDQCGKIDNNQTLEIKKNRNVTIAEGDESITLAKGNQTTRIKGNHSITLDSGNQEVAIKTGTQSVDVMGAIKITSKTSIDLKVGSNTISISPSGIKIKGVMLSCKGDATAEVKAGAMLTLNGGITKIN